MSSVWLYHRARSRVAFITSGVTTFANASVFRFPFCHETVLQGQYDFHLSSRSALALPVLQLELHATGDVRPLYGKLIPGTVTVESRSDEILTLGLSLWYRRL
jgi:hypothetical protein